MEIRFAPSAYKHRVTRASALEAMRSAGEPEINKPERGLDRYFWLGADHSGRMLEVIGIVVGGRMLIIHAMPYEWRTRRRRK